MKISERLAEVLVDALAESVDLTPDQEDVISIDCRPLADAVIEDLGLRWEPRHGGGGRWVSDWQENHG